MDRGAECMGKLLVRFCEGQEFNGDMDQYCGTATKVGGNRENKRGPVVMGVSCYSKIMENWVHLCSILV